METSYLGASDDPSSLPVRDEGDLKICQVLKEVNRHSKVYSCLVTKSSYNNGYHCSSGQKRKSLQPLMPLTFQENARDEPESCVNC